MPSDQSKDEVAAELVAARKILKRLFERYLHSPARGSYDDVQDLISTSLVEYARWLRENGPPDNPVGFLTVLAKRRTADFGRASRRRRAFEDARDPLPDVSDESTSEDATEAAEDAAIVLEYFRLHRPPCVRLAEMKAAGQSLREAANELGMSHEAVRKQWSRCVQLLHEAITRRRLMITGRWPARGTGRDDGRL